MDHVGHSDLPSLTLSSKTTFPVLCTISPGENHSSRLPKKPSHPMISDSFRSNISVGHTLSGGCVLVCLCICPSTYEEMFVHTLNTVYHPESSGLSNPGLQCLLISQGTMQKVISFLPPPTAFVGIMTVTDTWSCLVVYLFD